MEQVRLEGGPGRGTWMGGDAQGNKQCQGSWHLCVDAEDRKVQVPGEQRSERCFPPSLEVRPLRLLTPPRPPRQ